MRSYDPQKPPLFIHVPKSAGTAVRSIVESWFPESTHRHNFDGIEGAPPDVLAPEVLNNPNHPAVNYGHFNKIRAFGTQDYYPEDTQFVTILRDPFEALLSHYFFNRKTAHD